MTSESDESCSFRPSRAYTCKASLEVITFNVSLFRGPCRFEISFGRTGNGIVSPFRSLSLKAATSGRCSTKTNFLITTCMQSTHFHQLNKYETLFSATALTVPKTDIKPGTHKRTASVPLAGRNHPENSGKCFTAYMSQKKIADWNTIIFSKLKTIFSAIWNALLITTNVVFSDKWSNRKQKVLISSTCKTNYFFIPISAYKREKRWICQICIAACLF